MVELDLIIDDPHWGEEARRVSVCERALAAGCSVSPGTGTVCILLTNDDALQALNRQFRGKDAPTDVLSFSAAPDDTLSLGDVAISFGVAARDAAMAGKSLDDHLAHLVIHAFLHLQGHDHEADADAGVMQALEIKALASLGISNPYAAD
jgi:probable rRNA maturation factor